MIISETFLSYERTLCCIYVAGDKVWSRRESKSTTICYLSPTPTY